MLALLDILPKGVTQAFADGEMADTLLRTMDGIDGMAESQDGLWVIGLYHRSNPAGLKEVGLFYAEGSKHQKGKAFPAQMLRFFSKNRRGYRLAEGRYRRMIITHHLKPMTIVEEIQPD